MHIRLKLVLFLLYMKQIHFIYNINIRTFCLALHIFLNNIPKSLHLVLNFSLENI